MILTGRKKKILEAIIEDYIATAEPVGSRTLAKNYNLGISPATIRNEMADLEEMGYLEQPHTSAGRVPSDKGYRLYVDEILMNRRILHSSNVTFNMKTLRGGGVDKLLRETLKIISDLTEYTSIALTPQTARSTIKQVELLPFNENSLVVVLVTESGTVNDTIIKTNHVISKKEIDILNLRLNEILKGRNAEDIDDAMEEIKNPAEFTIDVKWLMNVIKNLLLTDEETEVLVEGTTNFFRFPEYRDIDRIRTILSFIENTRMILKLLMPLTNNDFSIAIGSENKVDEIKDCSIVTVTYSIKGKNAGTISIIGPKRMDYENAIGTMDEVGTRLNRFLADYLYGK